MMEDLIRSWLYSLLISGCICSFILYFNPDGKINSLLETGCACVMTLVFLSPFSNSSITDKINTYFESWSYIETEINADSSFKQSYRTFIEEEYSAYILNEARNMGIAVTGAEVGTEQDQNGNIIPASVTYISKEVVPNTFKTHIANQLGISIERQYTYENTRNIQKNGDS